MRKGVINNENSLYEIINSEVDYFKSQKGEFYLEKSVNSKLVSTHFENLLFDKKHYEFHRLITSYSFTKEEFQYFFSKNQIKYYKTQFVLNENFNFSKVKNAIPIDIANEGMYQKNKENPLFIEKKQRIVLSKPFFTKDNKYAIIGWSINLHCLVCRSISIYKKEGDKWVVYKRLLLGIG